MGNYKLTCIGLICLLLRKSKDADAAVNIHPYAVEVTFDGRRTNVTAYKMATLVPSAWVLQNTMNG